MRDVKDEILADAIATCISQEKELNRYKVIMGILALVIIIKKVLDYGQ